MNNIKAEAEPYNTKYAKYYQKNRNPRKNTVESLVIMSIPIE